MMDAIFGREDPSRSELLSPNNGLLMMQEAEQRFDKGYFVIVPSVSDSTSAQEIAELHATDVKDYEVRIANPGAEGMDLAIHLYNFKIFNELDDQNSPSKAVIALGQGISISIIVPLCPEDLGLQSSQ